MGDITRQFEGKWITTQEFAKLQPLNVFHRQLEPVKFPDDLPRNRHILFRRRFALDAVRPTALFISADDYYKLYINGRFVTMGPCPGYHFHYYYNKIDITDYLKPGDNVIAVHTYYQGLINRVWVSGDCRHGLIMDVVGPQGLLLCSDEQFRCHAHTGYMPCGIVGYETQFMEQYDSGAPEVGFERPEFDDSAWENASIRAHLDYELYEQPTQQLVVESVAPVSIETRGRLVRCDFGGMYVGYLSAIATGKRGSAIELRCGQELREDGSVRSDLRCNCRYEERWILSGGKDELKQYDYKSFRYAEFELPEGCELASGSIRLLARHYPFELHAAPNAGDAQSLAVWELCVRSLKYGVQEVIQDCMDREKGQYLGDGCYTALAHMIATRDPAIARKLIDDSLRSAFVNPGLMTCSTCSFMQEIAEYPLMLPFTMLAYWRLTGDAAQLEQWYEPTAAMLDFYRAQYEHADHLLYDLDKWCVVEWPAEYRDGYDYDLKEGRICKGTHNVINAYYLGAVMSFNAVARILKRPPYRDVTQLYDAYVGAFYDASRGLFTDSIESEHISMPGNMVAYMYGLCPEARTADNMLMLVRKNRLNSCMLFMTFPMLCGLKRTGNDALLQELLVDDGGWLRMLREGATATFEGWGRDAKWNTSLYHLTLSYALVFMTDWGLDDVLRMATQS